MPTDQILTLLIAERGRLNLAIEVLQGPATKRRGRPPKIVALTPVPTVRPEANGRKGGMTAAARKAQSKRMKAYWAAKRKASR
jgi:hypothetical protein